MSPELQARMAYGNAEEAIRTGQETQDDRIRDLAAEDRHTPLGSGLTRADYDRLITNAWADVDRLARVLREVAGMCEDDLPHAAVVALRAIGEEL